MHKRDRGGKRYGRPIAEAFGNDPFAPSDRSAHLLEAEMCEHQPRCPGALAPDHPAARVVATHPEQGWSLLCNGVVVFDDAGELLPDGRAVDPRPMFLLAAA